ncbi:MAG: porin [Methylophilaceae bacterium]|nr:porin [Methylophilaceae bacterium]
MKNAKLRGVIAAVSGALLMSFGANAMADSTDDIVNALIAKGVLTEEEGSLLLKGRAGEKEAAEKKSKNAVTATYKDGIVIGTEDGKNSIQINGRVHFDSRHYSFDEDNNGSNTVSATGADTFDIRRARIGVKARFLDYYSGEVVFNGTGNAPTLDVAYLNVAWWKPVQFRVGQFKMPFSLEQLTSSNNIDFVERSFVDAYIPAKEIGAMVHGSPWKGVTYALATSNGRGQNGTENDVRVDNKDIIGRATINFAEIMGNKDMVLHAGLAFSEGDISKADGAAAFGGNRSTIARGARIFTAPVISATQAGVDAEIDRSRLGLEAALAYGPFKVQGQWVRNSFDFETAANDYDVDVEAWYAEALWTITGEQHASRYKGGAFSGLKPKNNFDPKTFSGGAWEVGVRYSKFDASDFDAAGLTAGAGTDAGVTTKSGLFTEADAWTVGLKFVPNPHVRFMLDYVKTDFEKGIGGLNSFTINGEDEDDEKAILFRTQFAF